MILGFLTVLFFVAGLLLFYRMVRPRRRDVLHGKYRGCTHRSGVLALKPVSKMAPDILVAEHWAATSASFDYLADAARPRQQSDQNQILTNFVPTRMPLFQRASMPESFIIRLLFSRNDLRRFQLATKPMRNLAP
jgi:hypothetical protein